VGVCFGESFTVAMPFAKTAFAYTTLVYNLGTFVSTLDNEDVSIYGELQSTQSTLLFGVPQRIEQPDWKVEYRANFGEEIVEVVRSICEKTKQVSKNCTAVDYATFFNAPGEKALYLECKISSHHGLLNREEYHHQHKESKKELVVTTSTSELSNRQQHHHHGGVMCNDDVAAAGISKLVVVRTEPNLKASMEGLLILGQHQNKANSVATTTTTGGSGQEEGTEISTQNASASNSKELIESSPATTTARVGVVENSSVRAAGAGLSSANNPTECCLRMEGMRRKRQAVAAEPEELVGQTKPCPTCCSEETKFKYYNNKKVDQPRYQCLKCKIFFTHGGKKALLRGGGTTTTTTTTTTITTEASGSPLNYLTQPQITPEISNPSSEQTHQHHHHHHQQEKGKGVEEATRKRKAQEPPHLVGVDKVCRFCLSTRAVFKYLNNGREDQPRYRCLDCKEYFQFPGKRLGPRRRNYGHNNTEDTNSLSNAREATSMASVGKQRGKRPPLEPAPLVGLLKPCPVCGNLNTKFLYLNMGQPRYECSYCQHSFTFRSKLVAMNSDVPETGSDVVVSKLRNTMDTVEGAKEEESCGPLDETDSDKKKEGEEQEAMMMAHTLVIEEEGDEDDDVKGYVSDADEAHKVSFPVAAVLEKKHGNLSESCNSEIHREPGEPTVQSVDKSNDPGYEVLGGQAIGEPTRGSET